MPSNLNLLNSLATSSAALWRGTMSRPAVRQPAKMLELYDIENCPYCRLVRELLTELELEVLVYPCPKRGERYRAEAKRLGGKAQFPLLIDPNTGQQLYESADIIRYLCTTYGERSAPSTLRLKVINTASSMLASGLRTRHGMFARPSHAAAKPLILWGFESSPYARLVRERLCELELPYILRPIGKAQWQDFALTPLRNRLWPELEHSSAPRRALKAKTGQVMAPYLEDPNSGVALFESEDILDYLHETYSR
ncbi:glutathione S-transferase [Litorivivens lipolytica]|uniref:Glutathione S-transferase n=1 Tax=Litorivivens lipolytica TaxID=1524264 RepID=A0A7W4W4V8_9GAMM|nr:glutathione S-transferase N-terminal domain-containing protein [Litorivivens lipolytica]MBB3047467.1 glutathione S-transferase [Litorivivens lipolytica]